MDNPTKKPTEDKLNLSESISVLFKRQTLDTECL